jgi:hypothetical protein
VRFDGRAVLRSGRVCEGCLRSVAIYAWEDYRGVRLGTKLVREALPDSLIARCDGARRLLGPDRRLSLDDPVVLRAGATLLSRTLDDPERRFRTTRYAPATRPVSVLPAFWRVGPGVPVACVDAGPDTPRTAFSTEGWLWTGRGLTVLQGGANSPPLTILLDVPNGEYEAALGVRDLPPPPRFLGYDRWLRKRLRRREPKDRIALGRTIAADGRLRLDIPASLVEGRHVVAVHLRPPAHVRDRSAPDRSDDPALRERLRSLGYVE